MLSGFGSASDRVTPVIRFSVTYLGLSVKQIRNLFVLVGLVHITVSQQVTQQNK